MTSTATPLPVSTRRPFQSPEVGVAVAAFAALCVAVLTRSAQLLEPDDLAYRASIVALAHGHISLTTAQYTTLANELGSILQWVQLPNGSWLSEKNPGYPFFAAPFELLGALRVAPLFYGALGCLGLYLGGRRWLGRWGGTFAVVLYCASGAALVFAWRATMPTFTDASLIAAGTGTLLWTVLATDASARRRAVAGLLAFLALEGAVSIRYTNAVVLLVALVAVVAARRAVRLPWRTLGLWLASVGALVALLAAFDLKYYGGVLKTGYASGVITFDLSAIWPNLQQMPYHLVRSMPLLVLALVAAGWIALRAARPARGRGDAEAARVEARRDAAVGAALAACWLGIYALYAAYTWTVGQAGIHDLTLHVVRFYVPALAAVALLAAWLLARLPLPLAVSALATLAVAAAVTFPGLAGGSMPGGPGMQGGGIPGGPPRSGQPPGAPPTGQPPGAPPTGQVPGAPPSGQPPGAPPTGQVPGAPPSGQAPPGRAPALPS